MSNNRQDSKYKAVLPNIFVIYDDVYLFNNGYLPALSLIFAAFECCQLTHVSTLERIIAKALSKPQK